MYHKGVTEKNLRYNSSSHQQNQSLLPISQKEDLKPVLTSHEWPPSLLSLPFPLEAASINHRELPSIATLCASSSPFHSVPSSSSSSFSSREENYLSQPISQRSEIDHRQLGQIQPRLRPPPSPRERQARRAEQPKSPASRSQISTPNVNQPYTREHLHCVRYLKEDLHLPWHTVYEQFHRIFSKQPGFIERESEAALTSRSYRDNFIYASVNGKPLLNFNGMPIRVQAKVRQRLIAEEKHIPFKLVEKHPSWAVSYSWVRPEHKVQAQKILDGYDPIYFNSKKDQHRRVIEQAERIEGEMAAGDLTDADLIDVDLVTSSDNCLFITTPPASPEALT